MKIEFESIEDLYKAIQEAKDTFDEKEFIKDSYHMFLQAVQQGAERDVYKFASEEEWVKAGSPTWNPTHTPEDWFNAMLIETEIKIKMIRDRMKRKRDLSAFQKQIIPLTEGTTRYDRLELDDDKEVEETPYEFFEYQDWAAHKQKETIKKYLKGDSKLQLTELEIATTEADYEVGKYFAEHPQKIPLKEGQTARKLSDLIQLSGMDPNENQIN